MSEEQPNLGGSKILFMIAILLAASIIAFFLGYLIRSNLSIGENVSIANNHYIDSCIKEHMKIMPPMTNLIDSLSNLLSICSRQWHDEFLLDDFTIRRIKFLEQSRDGHVLLWVVVLITFSGVVLAAAQLAASYHLASAQKISANTESELTVEAGKISLKSSIVGLAILSLSLGFFTIFVTYVYPIKEINSPNKGNTVLNSVTQTSTAGVIQPKNIQPGAGPQLESHNRTQPGPGRE